MKKTIITLLAFAGVAAAESSVDIMTSMIPESAPTFMGTGSDSIFNLAWNPTFSGDAAAEATAMTSAFEKLGINSTGYYAFNQYGHGKNSGAITFNNNVVSIGAPSDNGSGAMFYVAIVSVTDLLQGKEFDALNSVTLTLEGNSNSSNDSWFSIYSMDTANTLTTIVELAVNNAATTSLKSWEGTKSYTIGAGDLDADDKVALLVRHSAATTLQLSNVYATANLTVPEPATATLSLLALAGIAARRRRR